MHQINGNNIFQSYWTFYWHIIYEQPRGYMHQKVMFLFIFELFGLSTDTTMFFYIKKHLNVLAIA